MKTDVVEIFPSFQGEGLYCGARQLFVRFFGCNLSCSYCDTPLKKPEFAEAVNGERREKYKNPLSAAELAEIIAGYDPLCFHTISFTGGEPLLQSAFLKELLPKIDREWRIFLETNGTLSEHLSKIINDIDIISMDYKLASVSGQRSFRTEHEAFLRVIEKSAADFYIKFVVNEKADISEIKDAFFLIAALNRKCPVILQPQWNEKISFAFFEKIAALAAGRFEIRLIPQCHKYLFIR